MDKRDIEFHEAQRGQESSPVVRAIVFVPDEDGFYVAHENPY